MNAITSDTLLRLLLSKHSEKFICVPECKTGSTWSSNHCARLDLWCMAKSWTRPRTIGYEIKVTRNDFLRDHKWRQYLEYCSEFYFVAPPGIIDPAELPDEAGLMISSKNAKMLYTQKKAPARSVRIPNDIFIYILMWRACITDERTTRDNAAYWREWLKVKDEKKKIGYNVGRTMRKIINERIDKVDMKNKHLERENERLAKVKEILEQLDIKHVNTWNIENKLKEKIKEINTGISGDLTKSIENSIKNLKIAYNILVPTEELTDGAIRKIADQSNCRV